jgi:hypothetical protein
VSDAVIHPRSAATTTAWSPGRFLARADAFDLQAWKEQSFQPRWRCAVEPVIGHLKAEHRMGCNYLWFRRGDAANAVLAAAGYNFRRLNRWLRLLLFLPRALTVPA